MRTLIASVNKMNFQNISCVFVSFNILINTLVARSPEHNESICGRKVIGQKKARILGGEDAAEAEFPWIVSIHFLKITEGNHHCAGSLISTKFVITAAHCVPAVKAFYKLFVVVAGINDFTSISTNAQFREIQSVFIHEGAQSFINDIALVLLTHPMTWTEFVRPICLPSSYDDTLSSKDGKLFWVSGWGHINDEGLLTLQLKRLKVPSVEMQTCQKVIEPNFYISNRSNLCAGNMEGNTGTCFGDSGGPLMDVDKEGKMVLIGIVAGGTGYPCGMSNAPNIYVRVDYYLNFIELLLRMK